MAAPGQPRLPIEPLECRLAAEDVTRPDSERLVSALLAIAGELATIRRDLAKGKR